jgi:hypothetical protein
MTTPSSTSQSTWSGETAGSLIGAPGWLIAVLAGFMNT